MAAIKLLTITECLSPLRFGYNQYAVPSLKMLWLLAALNFLLLVPLECARFRKVEKV